MRPVVPGWMGEVAEFKTPEILKTEQAIYIYIIYITSISRGFNHEKPSSKLVLVET